MNGVTSRCISFDQGSSDCLQRVNYEFGLVLGVDEFVDEQCYFLQKEYLHNRGLHGYGTVSGLLVSAGAHGDDIEVQVERGIGIDQYGRVFIVRATQCASLLSWLADHRLGAGRQSIYVVARYAECETALVPIAGQPCATSDQLLAPARLQDSFEIDLVLAPPDQSARDAVINLSEFLSRFRVDPNAADLGNLGSAGRLADIIGPLSIAQPTADFRTHVDQVVAVITGAAGARIIPILPLAVEDMLNDVFTYWVTVVRPTLVPDLIAPDMPPTAKAPIPVADILLARIDLSITAEGVLVVDNVGVDNTIRPYLLHTQLIEELYDIPDIGGQGGAVPAREIAEWVSLMDVSTRALSAWLHIGQDLDLQPDSNVHLQRVRPDGSLETLKIDLAEDTARRGDTGSYYGIRTFVNLNSGDFLVLTFDTNQIHVGGGGTLTDFIAAAPSTYPNYQPGAGRILAFHIVDRGQAGITEDRVRELIVELARPQQPVVPFVTVTPITEGDQAFAYELWFHLDGFVEQNEGVVKSLNEENCGVFIESRPNVVDLAISEYTQMRPNVWYVFPSTGNLPTRSLVRLAFSLDSAMGIRAFLPSTGTMETFETLREYIDKTQQRLDGLVMKSDKFGEVLVVYVREQGQAGRLKL